MRLWTDYPIAELGDIDGQQSPVREIELLAYDGNKYARVRLINEGIITTFKSGYIYTEPKVLDYKAGSNPKRIPYAELLAVEDLNFYDTAQEKDPSK
jgi:hypothetical protein